MNNETLIQFFEWYLPADGTLWEQACARAAELKEMGVTQVWLPPGYKGQAGRNDVGYGVYDLYDLGEFHQKGSVAAKYSTREQYPFCRKNFCGLSGKAAGADCDR